MAVLNKKHGRNLEGVYVVGSPVRGSAFVEPNNLVYLSCKFTKLIEKLK